MKPKNKKGFSLIELIFVIAILGIIAAVAVPKLLDTRGSAVVSTIKQDISTISTSIQSHYMINGSLTKITDAVNVNSQTWTITDKKLEFSSDSAVCVTLEIVSNKLNVTVDNTSSDLCQKIYDEGVRSVSYDLY
ncbi:MAG: type II secretion system protein [Campylobacterota bacterium]|nr:type II secretion system protein [Campylobacterota bacterium]